MSIINRAKSYIGLTEAGNRKEVDAFFTLVGQEWLAKTPDMEAWCAAFAGTVLLQEGYIIPQGVASVRAKDYAFVGTKVTVPEPGDMVLLNYGQQGVVDHVSFYIEDAGNGYIKCLGGNQSDSVKYSNFKKADVAGYYRPVKAITVPVTAAHPLPTAPNTTAPVTPTTASGEAVGGVVALSVGAAVWSAFGWIGLAVVILAGAAVIYFIGKFRATRAAKKVAK